MTEDGTIFFHPCIHTGEEANGIIGFVETRSVEHQAIRRCEVFVHRIHATFALFLCCRTADDCPGVAFQMHFAFLCLVRTDRTVFTRDATKEPVPIPEHVSAEITHCEGFVFIILGIIGFVNVTSGIGEMFHRPQKQEADHGAFATTEV